VQVQEPVHASQPGTPVQRWTLLQRVAFRFSVLYFGLFCIFDQPLATFVPMLDIDSFYTIWPIRQIVFWVGAHIFHAQPPLVYTGSGSGDKAYDWLFLFVLLVVSALGTLVWTILDRKRENYAIAYAWFRVFVRFMLASQLIVYGLAKVIPEQMPFPGLARLVEPFGNFSSMGVLWASIGASPSYEMFAGSAELLGGILLIFPRTTLLGALIAVADMTQVFVLNATYDVPVKLLSFHLLLLALFLLAPDVRRLANFFVLNRTAPSANQFLLFESARANRIALAAQIVLGGYLVAVYAFLGWSSWFQYGGGAPKSPLYGIWNVEDLAIDGKPRALVVTNSQGWRRIIFDAPAYVRVQLMDESFLVYGASTDPRRHTIILTKFNDKKWRATLGFQRAGTDRMTIEGKVDNHEIRAQLALFDRSKFLLVGRGFHWVQDYPFNR
jgi:uncharacterized membrane protein YphA (DoxX/SURF4 family)